MDDLDNCITPQGYRRLEAELKALWEGERPEVVRTVHWAASNGDRSENGDYIYGKKRLREIDRRVRFLRKRLEVLQVVDPRFRKDLETVGFGACVTYEREDGTKQTVTIVGADEIDPGQGCISPSSPIGRALLNRRVGDLPMAHMPGGEEELEVLKITYPQSNAD